MGKIAALFKFIVYLYNFFHPSVKKDPEVERLQEALKETKNEELERQKAPPADIAAAVSELPKS